MALVLTFRDSRRGRRRSVVLRGTVLVGTGGGPGALSLDMPGVAFRHAEIASRLDGLSEVRALSPDAAVFVNGRLVEVATLVSGDVVQLGTVVCHVLPESADVFTCDSEPADRPEAEARARASAAPEVGTRGVLVAVVVLALLIAAGLASRFSRRTARLPVPATMTTSATRVAIGRPAPRTVPTPLGLSTAPTPTRFPTTVPTPRRGAIRMDPDMENVLRAVVGITYATARGRALGTGFIATPGGLVVTNAHVVAGAADVETILRDGTRMFARVTDTDPGRDIALVRLPRGQVYPSLSVVAGSEVRVGQQVWAIGFPYSETLGFSVTAGIVSGLRTFPDGSEFIQHDAAINPGNSGGPLVDGSARVVGINTWKLLGSDRLGFAVTGDTILEFLKGRDE